MGLAKEKYSVGLDIGSSAIKLVKLKSLNGSIELCAFARAIIRDQADLAGELKKITEPQGIKLVNISLSGSSTVIRYVNFPRMSESELKGALKFEAAKYIPFQAEEANLDACILKADLPENKMLVALAAAKKDLVSSRLKLLESAGLTAGTLNIDALALINAFNFNYGQDEALKNKAFAVLNIGASLSSLSIIEDGIPRFSRDMQIAGNHFTQMIAEAFTLDMKAAESLKVNPDDKDKINKISASIEPALANLNHEIRSSCDYYESQGSSSVSKLFLSGGASAFIGIKDKLAGLLGMEVEYWDPLKRLSLSGSLDAQALKGMSGQLAVAAGLGLPR